MAEKVILKEAIVSEISELNKICTRTYTSYFANHWKPGGLELFLTEQFSADKLESDLRSGDVGYYFIKNEGKTAGFLKIKYRVQLKYFKNTPTCELDKIYLLPEYKGKGIGKTSLNMALELVRERGMKLIFLYVLETNKEAISFYHKLGFKIHARLRLRNALFKEHLKGLILMYLEL